MRHDPSNNACPRNADPRNETCGCGPLPCDQEQWGIPMWRVQVRHPRYGWQVVALGYTRAEATDKYTAWLPAGWATTLEQISGEQQWKIVRRTTD